MEEKYLEFAKDIAKVAGKIMTKYFKMEGICNYKIDKTIVSLADKEIYSYLIKRVEGEFLNHSVYGEEAFGESEYVWVCDPVEGMNMYTKHIPNAVFSLALVADGTPIVGVVYDVFTDSLYTAIKGQGAFKNNERIFVNDIELNDIRSISNFEVWPDAEYNILKTLKKLGKATNFVSIGSVIRACMCVASGEFTCAIFPGTKHKNCNIAAVKVIVEEAGGKVTDFKGNEQRYDRDINGAIVTNSIVHDKVLDAIKKFTYKKNK